MSYGLPYCGSKNRIARKVVDAIPITPFFIDMMCGGGAVSHRVIESRPQTSVHMNDIDPMLIDFMQLLNRGGYTGIDHFIGRDEFHRLKGSRMDIALAYSYGAKRINYLYGRQREEKMRMASEPHIGSMTSRIGDKRVRDVTRIRQMLRFQDAIMGRLKSIQCSSYDSYVYPVMASPENTVIYCDPPYEGKKGDQYCSPFDHERFNQWVRDSPYLAMVSEMHMPDDFICVAEFDRLVSICRHNRKVIEKLYVHADRIDDYRRMMNGDD